MSLADRSVQMHQMRVLAARGAVAAAQPGPSEPEPSRVATALQQLVEFIPTETITLFWLALPAASALVIPLSQDFGLSISRGAIDWAVLGFLVFLTPSLVILSYLSSLSRQHEPWPSGRRWPWWKAFAAMVSFTIWALAVPGNPFVTDPTALMSMWVLAAFVGTLIGLLDPIVENLAMRRDLQASRPSGQVSP